MKQCAGLELSGNTRRASDVTGGRGFDPLVGKPFRALGRRASVFPQENLVIAKPWIVLAAVPLSISLLGLAGCGEDERINAVSQSGRADAAADDDGVADDDDTPDDDTPDDDTAPMPTTTGRPMGTMDPMQPTIDSNLGQACDTAADCGEGFTCMTQDSNDFLEGGPPGGFCTTPCTGDVECLGVDSESFCLPLTETEAYCVPTCTPGDALLGEIKCGGRLDMACEVLDLGVNGVLSFCRPMCGSDADCGDRFCDIGIGVCVDELPEGDGIGGACDPETGDGNCATGACLAFSENYGACSGVCRTGTIGCGSGDAMPDDPGEPICLPLFEGVGVDGDVGQCIQRCNCDLDCIHPDAACFAPFDDDDATAMQILGTIGICINADAAEEDPMSRIGIECEEGRTRPDPDTDGGPGTVDSGPDEPNLSDSGPMMSTDSGGEEPATPDASSATAGDAAP